MSGQPRARKNQLVEEVPCPDCTSAAFFLVADIRRAAEYYRNRLGFRIIGYFY